MILSRGVLSNCVLLGVLLLAVAGFNYAFFRGKTKFKRSLVQTTNLTPLASLSMRGKYSLKTQNQLKDIRDTSGHDVVYYLCTTDVKSFMSLDPLGSFESSPQAGLAHIFAEIFIGPGGSNDTECSGALSRLKLSV